MDIVAAKAAQGVLGDPAGDGYVSASGTSMATPHVAGAAALLAQQHPDWTGARIKQTLTASAKPGTGLTPFQQGAGRADLTKAITQTVASEQTSVSFGVQQWPHTDDKPVTKAVTYRNSGQEPVTLELSLETIGPAGSPAPAGFFALGAERVTVPAGGTTSVDLTTNTAVGSLDGAYSGAVVATAAEGGQSVRISFGATREAEAYDLTLKFIDAKGKPAQAETEVYDHLGDFWENPYDTDGDGTVKARVPKGTYLISAGVATPQGDAEPDTAVMVRPKLTLSENTTITFDARTAKPVEITAPGSAKNTAGYLNYALESPDAGPSGGFGGSYFLDSFKGFRTAQVGPALPPEEFSSQVGGLWQEGTTNYNLLYNRTGSLHTGFTHKTATSELARVNLKIGTSAENREGTVNGFWGKESFGMGTVTDPIALPATVTSYVTAPKGFEWEFNASQQPSSEDVEDGIYLKSDAPARYEPKKTYEKTYNTGVFSPKVGSASTALRLGDELEVCIPEFSDGAGHFGSSGVTEQQTVITADGKKIVDAKGELCQHATGLPSASVPYRVSTDATRSTDVAGVTTRLTAAWTFTSKESSGADPVALPLSTVRFAPELSLASTAPAGEKLTVPLSVQGPAAAKGLKSLSVQVSYDGGTKWASAPVVTGEGGAKSLSLSHPKGATSVSLKAKLTDTKDNTYDVTVVKAYLLK